MNHSLFWDAVMKMKKNQENSTWLFPKRCFFSNGCQFFLANFGKVGNSLERVKPTPWKP